MAEEAVVVVGGGEGEGDVVGAVIVLSNSEVEAVSVLLVDNEGELPGDSEGVPNGVVSAELFWAGVAHVALGSIVVGETGTTRAGS